MIDVSRGDKVRGTFGVAYVTDVGYGFITDAATDEQVGPVDSLVRILQYSGDTPVYKYTNRSEIEEIL
jgi:hypothetical protein